MTDSSGLGSKIVFRDAGVSDREAVAALHALSWRTAYRGILAQEFLENVVEQDRLEVWRTRLTATPPDRQLVRLAVEDDQLIGFGCAFLDEDERWGALLDNLHVRPDCKGRGIGRQLMAHVASWVLDRRPSSALHLWVLEENHPARRFYERLGGAAVERVIHPAADDREVPSVRYVWHQPSELVSKLR